MGFACSEGAEGLASPTRCVGNEVRQGQGDCAECAPAPKPSNTSGIKHWGVGVAIGISAALATVLLCAFSKRVLRRFNPFGSGGSGGSGGGMARSGSSVFGLEATPRLGEGLLQGDSLVDGGPPLSPIERAPRSPADFEWDGYRDLEVSIDEGSGAEEGEEQEQEQKQGGAEAGAGGRRFILGAEGGAGGTVDCSVDRSVDRSRREDSFDLTADEARFIEDLRQELPRELHANSSMDEHDPSSSVEDWHDL